MELLTKFKNFIQEENLFQQSDRVLLAVSGGLDSAVLCELCQQAGFQFAIAHCNFQLRGEESIRDEQFTAELATRYNVPFFIKKFDTSAIANTLKKSIEETARDLRYEWFYELINETKLVEYNSTLLPINHILTAHHADDNIETVLMNFFRGTGIKGLRGILPKQGKIVRPLLFAKRAMLEAYASSNGLQYVTDSTNASNDYTRNLFRNSIIPTITACYPEAKENVLKNIFRFTEIESLYQQSIVLHKKKLMEQRGNEVHIPVLKLLNTTPIITVLYEIIKEFGFSALQTDEAVSLLKSDTGKYIQSATHRIIKNRNWLIITPVKNDLSANILISAEDKKILFEQGELTIQCKPFKANHLQTDSAIAQLDAAQIKFPLLLRKWKLGDYFYPLGMEKQKKINRFLIDQKLSLSQKEIVWVVEMDKKIIWVVGFRIDNRFKITNNTKNILSLTLKR